MRNPLLALAALALGTACRAGFAPSDIDSSATPQADFYQYADGGWLKANPIPSDHSSWSSFDEVQGTNEAILHRIAEDAASAKAPSFIEKMVGDFYFSGMDAASVDALGAAPLKPELDRIAALRSADQFGAEVARLHMIGVGACFAFGSEQDPKNSESMIAGQGQGGLGLPERDYYLRPDADSARLREKYSAHVERMLELAGDAAADAHAEAAAILRLETSLARGSKPEADLRDPVANYHMMPLGEAEKLSPHFGWEAYFAGIGLARPASLDVNQPEFLSAFDAELAATPVADWRSYFRWHLIHDYAPYLGSAFVDENFGFYARTLEGTPRMRERWRRVISVIDENVGEALGQLYVARAFPPESKARVLKYVTNIRRALRERIANLEWMDAPTRAAALRKLDAFGVKVGYPDKWIDYRTLVIDRGPYALNVLRSSEFAERRDIAKIGKPVDHTLWGITPPTVNAYYDPSQNEIVFAAGIFQPPFFDPKAEDAVNYGAIGMVIGHEMTHGFDDEGRQFDARGNLSDWWSPESARRFNERAAAIVKQFSAYVAVDSLHVNGVLTEGENIADLGGVKLSYTAFMESRGERPEAASRGFTPEQLFFLSFASLWRTNERPEALRLQVNTDTHSPARFRVDGPLSNLPEFAAAFHVPEGAPMRRPAAERVVIW